MEQRGQPVGSLLSPELDRLTSETQHWGGEETAEGTEAKGPISKEQTLQGRMASQ